MKKEKFSQLLSNAFDALLCANNDFEVILKKGFSERSDLLKKYYSFANTLTCHIQAIDSITLSLGNEIQDADKQNDTNEILRLESFLLTATNARRLCEEFLTLSEQDVEEKQLTAATLQRNLDTFTRKVIVLKNTL